jgi:hypothetical protein
MLTVAIALASFHMLLGASPFRSTEAKSQPHPQGVIVQQLLSGDATQQRKALDSLEGLEGGQLSEEVKNAMATALQQESRRHVQRYWQVSAKAILEPMPDPELLALLARSVSELHDPGMIPALAESLGVGFSVTRAHAEFGDAAADAVLDIVMSPQSTHYAVNDGLIALRLMVELAGPERGLPPSTMARIREAAEYHLTSKPRFIGTVWWALDLAAVLPASPLREIVEAFASDPALARAMGATDPDVVYQTQRRAADRLAGVPPLPRP